MEHQGCGNLWAELKPQLWAAGTGVLVSPQNLGAPQLPVLTRGLNGCGGCW